MKRLNITIIFLSIILANFSAQKLYAKTQGSYLSLDAVKTKYNSSTSVSSVKYIDLTKYMDSSNSSSASGVGISYKYSYDIGKGFFVAPGIFYENLGIETQSSKDQNFISGSKLYMVNFKNDLAIKDRYGFKIDLGYEIKDRVLLYIPVGISAISYEFTTIDTWNVNEGYAKLTQKGNSSSYMYGIGTSIKLFNNTSLNIEYNISSYDIESKERVGLIFEDAQLKTKVDLKTIKVGISYKF